MPIVGQESDRLTKLERLYKELAGTTSLDGSSITAFPVRNLALAEEVSIGTDGTISCVVVATWAAPSGVNTPLELRVSDNTNVQYISGSTLTCRFTGYVVGDTVTVSVSAVYVGDNMSIAKTAEITLYGDSVAPGVPQVATATGGFQTITIRWANPSDSDFSHCEVWESITNNNIETAERIAQAYGNDFVRSNVGVLETRWYWVRAIDRAGNASTFVGPVSATTIAISSEDIPDNTVSESMLVTTLSGKINNSEAAIQIIDEVRTGAVNVSHQATAPTSGMTTGDLWIDNNDVVHRYEGDAWVAKSDSTVYDLLKAAIAQYVVKTQTMTGDGKLKIAGFGIFNDATTGSEFAVLADKFYVYAEKADGTSYTNLQVFTVDATTTPPTVNINGNLIVDGSITGEKISSAAQITLGDGGKIITGENTIIQMASGVFALDSSTGVMTIRDPGDLSAGDFITINVGDITSYKYLDGAYRSMKSLRKMVTGTNIPNDTTVTLSGAFPSQPEILVSPCNLQTFNKGYGDQNQTLLLQAKDINYNPTTGVCTFVPKAELGIAVGSGVAGSINPDKVSTGTATISNYNPDNVSSFTPVSVILNSSSIPANVSTVSIDTNIYAQAMHNDQHGTTFGYCLVPHTIDYVIYATISGVDYVVGSGTISRPVSLIDITSEPTSQYVNKQKTITVNTASTQTIVIWASITPRDDVGVMGDVPSYALGYKSTPYSTDPYNIAWLSCESISYILASATLLATGTLNYMAIAE